MVGGRFKHEDKNEERDIENTSHWQADELQGKVGQCFLSDSKVGPQVVSEKVLQNSKTPTTDILVLNSVNNLDKATGYLNLHESFICFLGNDQAGRKCLEDIQKMFPGKEIKDMSGLYSQHKDLNEMLQNCRGYSLNQTTQKNSL